MEDHGPVPVPLQFWASWRAVVGFCGWESHQHISHQPLTSVKCRLCLSTLAGWYSLHPFQKNSKYLGRATCVHSYTGGEAGSTLPIRPWSSHLVQSHLSTHSHPVPQAGAAPWLTGLVATWLSLLLKNVKPGKGTFPLPRGSQSVADLSQVSGDFIFWGMVVLGLITDEPIS